MGLGTTNVSLTPITSSYPILAWVWSYIVALHLDCLLCEQTQVAVDLSSLAKDNDLYTNITVQEGRVRLLLNLLEKGGASSSDDSQIAVTNALNLVTDAGRFRCVVNVLGDPADREGSQRFKL